VNLELPADLVIGKTSLRDSEGPFESGLTGLSHFGGRAQHPAPHRPAELRVCLLVEGNRFEGSGHGWIGRQSPCLFRLERRKCLSDTAFLDVRTDDGFELGCDPERGGVKGPWAVAFASVGGSQRKADSRMLDLVERGDMSLLNELGWSAERQEL